MVAVLTGCAGFKVGPVSGEVAGAKSVQIVPFRNQTLEPALTDWVTTELRRYFQQDGTYKLATHDDGDIIVTGVISRYDRSVLTISSRNTITAKDIRITITAEVTARTRATGDVIFTHLVNGSAMAQVGNDMTSSERQTLPLVAADLAKNAVSLLTEGRWW